MNLIKVLPLFTLICSAATFAAEQPTINERDLYGNWNCNHVVDEPKTKMKVKVDYNVNFARAGKASGFGTLAFNVPNFSEVQYTLADNSSWKVTGNQLVLSSTDVRVIKVSHPEFEQLLNLKQFIPKQINESVTILKLSQTSVDVRSEVDGKTYTCTKR